MSAKKEDMIFSAFGFDILLHDVEIKKAHGEEYPDININELKLLTAKTLLQSKESLTGSKLKFLRTFLKLSHRKLSSIVGVPEATLRSWETKHADKAAGLQAPEERQLRIYAIDYLTNLEKRHLEKEVIKVQNFDGPSNEKPLELKLALDYSYLKEA